MQELLLEDCFQDIFLDSVHLEAEATTDQEELHETVPLILDSQAGPSTAGSSKKPNSLLNKKERQNVVKHLKGITGAHLLDTVVKHLSEAPHMQYYLEREEMFASLLDSCKEELETICAGLASTFIEVYKSCDTGKEKYGRFQVKWHSSCSEFLLDTDNTESDWCSLSPPKLWLAMTRSVPKEVRNPVMIAITSSVYQCMLQTVSASMKGDDRDILYTTENEADEVYLRFGGGALADMIKLRYKEMKSKKPSHLKEKVSQELQVLQWMRMVDKSSLPPSLAYRDQGGMYFPDLALLPFIKSVDTCVRENTNDIGFKRYGKNLVRVVTEQVQQNQLLVKKFEAFVYSQVDGAQSAEKAIASVYSEFTRKLCNTRVNEFLDTYRQRLAKDKGKATLAGQNLRDTLLSQHVNLKPQ